MSINSKKILQLRHGETVNNKPVSLENLASSINVSRVTIHYIESGKNINPSFDTITKYCEHFNISPYELMREDKGRELLFKWLSKMRELNYIDEESQNKIISNLFAKKQG